MGVPGGWGCGGRGRGRGAPRPTACRGWARGAARARRRAHAAPAGRYKSRPASRLAAGAPARLVDLLDTHHATPPPKTHTHTHTNTHTHTRTHTHRHARAQAPRDAAAARVRRRAAADQRRAAQRGESGIRVMGCAGRVLGRGDGGLWFRVEEGVWRAMGSPSAAAPSPPARRPLFAPMGRAAGAGGVAHPDPPPPPPPPRPTPTPPSPRAGGGGAAAPAPRGGSTAQARAGVNH